MNKRALLVFIACFCTVFVTYCIRYGYGVVLPEMLPSLAITKTQAGVIYSSYFIVYTLCAPVLGLLGDRYNTRIILASFSALMGVGAFLMAFSSSVVEASVYFGLTGLGASACWAPLMALAQRWVSTKRKGLTLALIDSGSALGIIWMGTVVPWIINNHGWPAGWMSMGSLGILLAVINFVMVRSRPTEQDASSSGTAPPAAKPVWQVYGSLARNSRFWLFGLSYLLIGFSVIIPFTFLNTYAVEELGFSYQAGASFFTVIGAGAVVGKLVLGSLSDRLGRIRIIIICTLLVIAGTAGMAYSRGFLVMAAFVAVFSTGYGAVWSMYAAAASDYIARGMAGSIVGLWTMYLGIGSVLAPIIAGWVADATGTLSWSFIVAATGAAAGLILLLMAWLRIREPVEESS